MIGEKSWAIEMNRSILVVLAVVVLLMFGAAWKMQANTQARADALAAQQAAQREAEAAREKREQEEAKRKAMANMPAEAQAYIANNEADKAASAQVQTAAAQSDASAKQVADLYVRWKDAEKIAGSVGRIAMGQPVAELQKIKREVDALPVSECMKPVRASLAVGMEKTIDAYVYFLGNTGDLNDLVSRSMLSEAEPNFKDFEAGIERCRR